MSINVGKGFRPSRKSDIEELIYTILYLNKGSLPWSNIRGKDHGELFIKINNVKINIEPEKLFADFPHELLFIYKNVLKLNFYEKQEYMLYNILFENIIRRFNNGNIKPFEFSCEKILKCLLKNRNYSKMTNKKDNNFIRKIFKGYPL